MRRRRTGLPPFSDKLSELMQTIQLQWRLEHGSEGLDTDANNPLSRALNRLFQDGKPFRRISLCWFEKKWLGVFAITAHQRLVFFPGFDFTSDWIRILRGELLQTQRPFDVDIFHSKRIAAVGILQSPNRRGTRVEVKHLTLVTGVFCGLA